MYTCTLEDLFNNVLWAYRSIVRWNALRKWSNVQNGHPDFQSLTPGTNGDLTEDFSLISQQRPCIVYCNNSPRNKPHLCGNPPHRLWTVFMFGLGLIPTWQSVHSCVWPEYHFSSVCISKSASLTPLSQQMTNQGVCGAKEHCLIVGHGVIPLDSSVEVHGNGH